MTAQNGSHLPNWFIRNVDGLTSIERMVWVVLSNRAGTKGWNLNATEIARQAGCAERSVYTALAILEHCGLIVRTRRGRETKQARNRYRVTETLPAVPTPEQLAHLRRATRETAPRAVSKGPEIAPRAVSALHHVQSQTAPCADSDCTTCRRKETQETQEMNPPSGDSSSVSLERTTAAAPAALRKSSAPLPQPLDEATDRNRVAINFAIPMPEFEHLDDWVRIAANDPTERLYTPGAPAGTLVLDRLALAVVNGEVDEDDLRTRYSAALAELRSTAAARGWVCADVLAELRTAASVDPALHRLEIRECDPAEPGMPRTHTTTELSHYPAPSTEGANR